MDFTGQNGHIGNRIVVTYKDPPPGSPRKIEGYVVHDQSVDYLPIVIADSEGKLHEIFRMDTSGLESFRATRSPITWNYHLSPDESGLPRLRTMKNPVGYVRIRMAQGQVEYYLAGRIDVARFADGSKGVKITDADGVEHWVNSRDPAVSQVEMTVADSALLPADLRMPSYPNPVRFGDLEGLE